MPATPRSGKRLSGERPPGRRAAGTRPTEERTSGRRSTPSGDARLLLLNKPYDVLCQFSDAAGRRTLADFVTLPGVYPAGRLDRDSEGLVLLTGDGALQHRISHPRHKLAKRYLVQVDGEIEPAAIARLVSGVHLKDGAARAVAAERIEPPERLWPRDPPVRYRASIPTSWIALTLEEGRNRQVRRMTAAAGHPTLRLVRVAVGPYTLGGLAPGEHRLVRVRR